MEITERKKAIEIEEKEILRKEKELEGVVRKPAEAEAFRVEQVANALRCASPLSSCCTNYHSSLPTHYLRFMLPYLPIPTQVLHRERNPDS